MAEINDVLRDLREVLRETFHDEALVAAFNFPSPDFRVEAPIEVVRSGRLEGGKFTLDVDVWAIRWMGRTWNKSGEWEWEPLPSSRDAAYLAANRWGLIGALKAAAQASRIPV